VKSRASKRFTIEEFCRVQRAASFVGAVAFWQRLERLSSPDWRVRNHAILILEEIGRLAYIDCEGVPVSPEEAECFRLLGLQPQGVRAPGECTVKEEHPC
jgi:hypothetical protein